MIGTIEFIESTDLKDFQKTGAYLSISFLALQVLFVTFILSRSTTLYSLKQNLWLLGSFNILNIYISTFLLQNVLENFLEPWLTLVTNLGIKSYILVQCKSSKDFGNNFTKKVAVNFAAVATWISIGILTSEVLFL